MTNKNIDITFTGDLSCTGIFHNKVDNNNEIFDTSLLKVLSKSDFVVCNFEGPATNHEIIYRKDVQVKSPKNSISYLKSRNINIFNLANNHIFDAGLNGFIDTLNEIKKEGAVSFGAGNSISESLNPIVLNTNGISIGLIAICDYSRMNATENSPGINAWKGIHAINKIIKRDLKNCDWIVLNFHGGEEYTLWPSPPKRSLLKKIAEKCKVDIIIAHHSHSFQQIEKFKTKLIFHSLGNFVFDILPHQQYSQSLKSNLVKLSFSKTDFHYSLIPIEIDTKKGFINKSIKEPGNREHSVFNNYRSKWHLEAYNVLFNRTKSQTKNIERSNPSLQEQSFIQILFRKKFYLKVFLILKDKYARSLYIGAIIHKLTNSKS